MTCLLSWVKSFSHCCHLSHRGPSNEPRTCTISVIKPLPAKVQNRGPALTISKSVCTPEWPYFHGDGHFLVKECFWWGHRKSGYCIVRFMANPARRAKVRYLYLTACDLIRMDRRHWEEKVGRGFRTGWPVVSAVNSDFIGHIVLLVLVHTCLWLTIPEKVFGVVCYWDLDLGTRVVVSGYWSSKALDIAIPPKQSPSECKQVREG